MSRIGKQPIIIPENVDVKINDDEITVKGPKGELKLVLDTQIKAILKKDDNNISKIIIKIDDIPKKALRKARALWGLYRSLVFNMVEGVINGFEKKLEIEGVGYRASAEGNKLVLNIGLSHPVEIQMPEGISLAVEKSTIIISGIDKQLVGEVAAKIRAKRKPEPYKGKGIRYSDEVIRRKAGKKAAGTE